MRFKFLLCAVIIASLSVIPVIASEYEDVIASEYMDVIASDIPDVIASEYGDVIASEYEDVIASEYMDVIASDSEAISLNEIATVAALPRNDVVVAALPRNEVAIAALPRNDESLECNVGEIVVKRSRDFKGEALYGYMNGGSDLYLEYGFVSLNVRDLVFDGHEYTVESFKMKDEIAAYGIYSIHIFKPLALDTFLTANGLEGFDALSKYQLQGVYGDTYYSIIFNEGAVAAEGAQRLLLDEIASVAALHRNDEVAALPRNDEVAALPRNDTTAAARGGDLLSLRGEAEAISLREIFKTLPDIVPPYSGNLKYVCGELGLGNVDDTLLQEYSEKAQHGLWIYEDINGNQVVKCLHNENN